MFNKRLKLVPLFIFFFVFIVHQYIFLDFFPNQNNRLGHDFEYFLPNFVFGKIWFQNNFLSIPWFSPSFCCGTPFYPDPQTAFYSIQQIFYIFFNPILATKLLFAYFSFLGFCGMYFLLRKNFNISFFTSLLGATLFIFNGFFIFRSIIGHIAYINFSLIPIYCYFLIEGFTNRNLFIKNIYLGLSSLVLSSFFYSGAGPIMPLIILCIFSILLFFSFKIKEFKIIFLSLIKSFSIGILISISKISASLFFLNNFKRKLEPIYFESPIEYLNLIFKSLFFVPDIGFFNKNIFNKNISNFGIHEIEYGVTFVPLLVFFIFLINLKKFIKNKNFSKILLLSLIIILLPIILNTNLFNYQSFWNSIPIIGSSWVQVRWSAIYIIPLILFSVIVLENINIPKYKNFILVTLFFIVIFQNILRDKSFYHNQKYNPKDIVKFSKKIDSQNLEKNYFIRGYAAIVDKDDKIVNHNKRNDLLTFSLSSAFCYQPLFGYNLKNFPKKNIIFNKKIKISEEKFISIGELHVASDKNKFNFFNPSCFLFPNENDCSPGDLFNKSQEKDLKNFLNYKKFDFKKNKIQNIFDNISLFSLLILIVFLIRNLYLLRKNNFF